MLAICGILLCIFVTYIYYIHLYSNYVTQIYVNMLINVNNTAQLLLYDCYVISLSLCRSLLNCKPYVLKTCSRANVPCVLTCLRAVRDHLPMCLACLGAHVPTCSSANVPQCSCANVRCMLTCSCVNVPSSITLIIYNPNLLIIFKLKKREYR